MGDEMAHTDYPRWPLPDEPGRLLFDRYELIERIGEGAMAVVWRVLRLDLGCERALKLIRPEIAQNDSAWQRLEREVRLIAQLRHPNIVDIYDVKRSHGIGYIEMELVRGRSLAEILEERRGQPMPLGWTIQVCSQLCSALKAAHGHVDAQTGKSKPIIHCDLKPSNLMLIKHDRTEMPSYLVVLDFGLARMLENDGTQTFTSAGEPIITPAYMSPERIRGGVAKEGARSVLDGRSDLYSAGVILYQLLTGSPPFRGTSLAVCDAHLSSPPLPMKKANPAVNVPPEVERAIMQCLEKNPRKRPRSAAELARLIHLATPRPGASAPLSTSPMHGIGSSVRLVLGLFHRSEAVITAAWPTREYDESKSKATDQPTANEPPVPRPRPAIESRPETVDLSLIVGARSGMKLYVGNLANWVSSSDLEQLFSEYGSVESAEVFTDRDTGKSKGFGFVEMSNDNEARAAIDALNDQEHYGRRLTVNQPRPREPRTGRDGGWRGGLDKVYIAKDKDLHREVALKEILLKTIRRHTDVSFPAVVQAGKVYNLRIQLVPAEEALLSGAVRERPRPHAHDTTLNLLVAPPIKPDSPPPPVKVTISVAAENFEISGLSRVEIVVPLAGKSPAVQFSLQGMEAGPGRIMVDFAQDGRPAGSVDLIPEVVADIAALPRAGWTGTTIGRTQPQPGCRSGRAARRGSQGLRASNGGTSGPAPVRAFLKPPCAWRSAGARWRPRHARPSDRDRRLGRGAAPRGGRSGKLARVFGRRRGPDHGRRGVQPVSATVASSGPRSVLDVPPARGQDTADPFG